MKMKATYLLCVKNIKNDLLLNLHFWPYFLDSSKLQLILFVVSLFQSRANFLWMEEFFMETYRLNNAAERMAFKSKFKGEDL